MRFSVRRATCLFALVASMLAVSAPPAAAQTRVASRLPVAVFASTLPNGDAADVYHPSVPGRLRPLLSDAFPVVAVLQGANVDKAQYSGLGRQLARMGFVVVIPNHVRAPGGPFPPGGLFTSPTVVPNVLAEVLAQDTDPTSPLYRVVDTAHLALVGHSFGGAVGLFAASGVCPPPICDGPYTRPPALTAAAFYGTNLATGTRLDTDVDTTGVAVALVQGTLDGVAPPIEADTTYQSLERPRALITVAGANHYGITDTANPPGGAPDPVPPTLSQERATTEVARWSGLWLRAQIQDDLIARSLIYRVGGSRDGVVTVRTD
ncbi:alpha/beta hydrolase family protein [Micromonospora sp. BQ11]|uniref:alpha/beta hydrolase family protein n=1 Tax=Micromonospora sp. BQ11 TaxID=3452212 RepID=UPI003F8CC3A1